MELVNNTFNPILGEIGCKFRSIIEDHIKDYELQKDDDVEWLLEPLDLISHPADIVLDAFCKGDFLGSVYELYFHDKNASAIYVPFDYPYEKYNGKIDLFDLDENVPDPKPYNKTMLVKGLANLIVISAIPEIWDDLTVSFTELGIWQALLLNEAYTFMPKGWHGNYFNYIYVFSHDDMQRIIVEPKRPSYNFDHKKLKSYLGQNVILPSVKIEGDKAVVTYCVWSKWSGFCRCSIPVEKHGKSVTFGKKEQVALVEYDCGIRY